MPTMPGPTTTTRTPPNSKSLLLPVATLRDTLGVIAEVVLPTVAKGVIIRRPRVMAAADWLELDRRAIRRMQRLQETYGPGPLCLRLPGRSYSVILSPDDVHRVLEGSPEPFATAAAEKQAALAHFQPDGVLISHGPDRADRRRFNEAVLDTDRPVHRLAERFVVVVDEEANVLLAEARRCGTLDWDAFADAWFRTVRRVVFGDAARDDRGLRVALDRNWSFLRRRRTALRRRFYARLQAHLTRAEPGSLAAVMATIPASERTAPAQQVPQWLFAFDPAGMATFRALALLAAHPAQAAQARAEIADRPDPARLGLPYLRACILESLRLWPTTPIVLRETTSDTAWETAVMPAGTAVVIFAPYFHRDDRHLPYADSFRPELWLEDRSAGDWPLIPFSGGPAMCPGRNLVLLLGSAMLAALLNERELRLERLDRLDPSRPLPATLDNFSLRFELAS
jgi:cytochrome P450